MLKQLKKTYGAALTIVDFRGLLASDSDWNDEMHPNEAAFQRLAEPLRVALRAALAAKKRPGVG